jgi:Family of unknown function (DUF5694)
VQDCGIKIFGGLIMPFKKEIILVGTFHFEQDAEILKDKDREIEELVEYLADYKPSKIALEWDVSQNEKLNEEYKNSDGRYLIDEIQQIGFRLAKRMQHDKVYGVNWAGYLTQKDMETLNNTIQSSYPEILNTMGTFGGNTPEISSDIKLIGSYQRLNNRVYINELEKMYLSFVVVQDDKDEMVGFNFLNKWLERELMIFKNIFETTSDNSDERILLVIGSDHLWMLTKLFEGNGWNVINPFSNLKLNT